MKTLVITSLTLLLSAITAIAAKNPTDLAKPILQAIESGNTSNLASLAYPEGSPQRKYFSQVEVEKLDRDFASTLLTVGKANGYALLHRSEIKDIYIVEYYIFRFERQPAILKLSFYKPNTEWRLQQMSVNLSITKYMDPVDEWSIGRLGLEHLWRDWERGDIEIISTSKESGPDTGSETEADDL